MPVWIGLLRGELECNCTGLNDECDVCRQSWLISDGTPISSFAVWQSSRMPTSQDYGFMTDDGWGSDAEHNRYNYICEKYDGTLLQLGIYGQYSVSHRTVS